MNEVTILGSGTSTGIPMIGCSCMVCHSVDHRDQRLRTSIFITSALGKHILVDTSPDLRRQLLDNNITSVDFVLITHDHADHLHGIDDLRSLTFLPCLKSIPVYCEKKVVPNIVRRFGYIFDQQSQKKKEKKTAIGGGIPNLSLHSVELMQETVIQGEKLTFFNYPHGHDTTMGFVHEKFAYIVDCTIIPAELIHFLKLKKIDLLVIDCLQRHAHATHLTVEKAFAAITAIAPKQAGLIHMGHDLSHVHLESLALRAFPRNQNISVFPLVFPLYDQQKLRYFNA